MKTKILLESLREDLAILLEQIAKGESFVIFDGEEAIAQLTPPPENAKNEKYLRPIGLAKGQITISDDFNDPLPKEIEDLFYGEGDGEL